MVVVQRKLRRYENKTERIKRMIENGILTDSDIATSCQVKLPYVKTVRRALEAVKRERV